MGMKLTEFATAEAYNDWWSALGPIALLNRWIFFGATYNNGDNTDSWCSNYKVIPDNIITNKYEAYDNCKMEFQTQRLVVDESIHNNLVIPADRKGAHIYSCSP
jgi:hypothetical protein